MRVMPPNEPFVFESKTYTTETLFKEYVKARHENDRKALKAAVALLEIVSVLKPLHEENCYVYHDFSKGSCDICDRFKAMRQEIEGVLTTIAQRNEIQGLSGKEEYLAMITEDTDKEAEPI